MLIKIIVFICPHSKLNVCLVLCWTVEHLYIQSVNIVIVIQVYFIQSTAAACRLINVQS